MNREEALDLLRAQGPDPSMMQHALASEAVMRTLAVHFGEDEDLWAVTGLLHDLDYPLTKDNPKEHGAMAANMLDGKLPPEAVAAIKAHNSEFSGLEPQSRFDYALRAGESITGMISAAALMRPTGMEGMQVKSIKKKMKDKSFAASVNRERIRECEQAGLPLDTFIGLAIEAMTPLG